jgi:uracil-DNA glycosylase
MRPTAERPGRPRLPEEGQAVVEKGAAIEHVAGLASTCRDCDLWERATQAVFGRGRPRPR